MNAAAIIIVLTTMLVHCGHCQQRMTFSALQDTPKTLHSRSISNRRSPGLQTCTEKEANLARDLPPECAYKLRWGQTIDSVNRAVICQQQCRDKLLAYYTLCNPQGASNLMGFCSGTGSSAEAPTFFKTLFLMTSIVMAMLLL